MKLQILFPFQNQTLEKIDFHCNEAFIKKELSVFR